MQSATDSVSSRPVDLEHLRRFTLGDADLEREILGLFADHAPTTLAGLAAAETPQEWRAAAHSLKGSANAIGAHHLAKLAGDAERTYPDEEAKQAQLAAVQAAFEAARDYIAQLRATFTPSEA